MNGYSTHPHKSTREINLEGNGFYGWRAKIGLLVVSTDLVCEPAFNKIVPSGVSIHTARMTFREATPEALLNMTSHVERAAKDVASAKVDLIVFGCTSGSFLKGTENWNEEIMRRIEDAAKIPAITTTTAVAEALKKLGIKRVAVVTPYIDAINVKGKKYLENIGFKVVNILGMQLINPPEYQSVRPSEVYKFARTVDTPEADGMFISCTAFRALEIAELLEKDIGKPVVTSNSASIWYALRKVGIDECIRGYGQLLRI